MTETPPSSRRRILIVDDEILVAMDTETQLRRLGYEVTGIASSGREALQLCKTTPPDLVLMGVQLRGAQDGIATAKELQLFWNVPVIFVTAFTSDGTRCRAAVVNPSGFLSKPYRPEELRAAVSAALSSAR